MKDFKLIEAHTPDWSTDCVILTDGEGRAKVIANDVSNNEVIEIAQLFSKQVGELESRVGDDWRPKSEVFGNLYWSEIPSIPPIFISRNKAVFPENIYEQESVMNVIDTLMATIEDIPTIEAEKIRNGEWIHNEGYDKRDNFYTCSLCGRTINIICGDRLENYPYCHCGAKMTGEEK